MGRKCLVFKQLSSLNLWFQLQKIVILIRQIDNNYFNLTKLLQNVNKKQKTLLNCHYSRSGHKKIYYTTPSDYSLLSALASSTTFLQFSPPMSLRFEIRIFLFLGPSLQYIQTVFISSTMLHISLVPIRFGTRCSKIPVTCADHLNLDKP